MPYQTPISFEDWLAQQGYDTAGLGPSQLLRLRSSDSDAWLNYQQYVQGLTAPGAPMGGFSQIPQTTAFDTGAGSLAVSPPLSMSDVASNPNFSGTPMFESGGAAYAPTDFLQSSGVTGNSGFWNGPGPFLMALGLTGGVIGGGLAGAAPAAEGAPASYFGVGEGVGGMGGFDPYALTGPATTGAEGGLATGAPFGEGSLTGPMTTGLGTGAAAGIPFQEGYNFLDPSTYGGSGASGIPGLPPGSSTIAQQLARLLGTGAVPAAAGAGGAAAGAPGGNLGSMAGIGTGLYDLLFGGNKVDPAKLNYLWQAGVDTYNTARDPQQALYGRTVQQLQDQTRAAQSARGTAMSPWGAAGEADVMKNFNIDWNNQALARQLSGLEGLGTASGGYFRQNNIDNANRNASIQSGTNALLTGVNTGMAPGGWLNTLWNPQNQTPAPGAAMPPSDNYWGSATPGASFQNPQFNMFDPSTFYGGAGGMGY